MIFVRVTRRKIISLHWQNNGTHATKGKIKMSILTVTESPYEDKKGEVILLGDHLRINTDMKQEGVVAISKGEWVWQMERDGEKVGTYLLSAIAANSERIS